VVTKKHFTAERILITLIILLIALLAYYVALPHAKSKVKTTQTIHSFTYTYTNFEQYTLASPIAGTSVTFDKPVEFKSTLNAPKAPVAELHHKLTKTQQLVGDIVVNILPKSKNDPTKSIAQIKQNVSIRMSNLNVDYGTPQTKQLPNLKDATVLQMDFTANSTTKGMVTYPAKQGTALLITGKNAEYYVLLDALKDNWQANQTAWQKVISSLAVDLN
jgi:hypothetical protein